MKNIIIKSTRIFSLLFLFSCMNAQTIFNNDLDRTEYLKTFEINKAKYIGKTFTTLLNDMKSIQPVTCFSMSAFNNKNVNIKTIFHFVSKGYATQFSPILQITWKAPFLPDQATYYTNKNKSAFTLDEKTYYGNKIIKDIKVY